MKKLMMTVALCAASVAARADVAADAATLLAEYCAGYSTNGISGNIPFAVISRCFTNNAFAAAADDILCHKPFALAATYKRLAEKLPKTHTAALTAIEGEYPAVVAVERSGSAIFNDNFPLRIQYFIERICIIGGVKVSAFNNMHQKIMDHAKKSVVKKLRSERISIVGDGGKTTMQQRLDALQAALDAPALAGISNALDSCGIAVRVPDIPPRLPSGEVLAKLKEDIFNGILAFNDLNQGRLRLALGLSEYNSFVNTYNGGTK